MASVFVCLLLFFTPNEADKVIGSHHSVRVGGEYELLFEVCVLSGEPDERWLYPPGDLLQCLLTLEFSKLSFFVVVF